MSSERDDYGTNLAEELGLRDVPEDVADRIVREVNSHVIESGEDPFETFGTPERYADEFAPRSWSRRMLWACVAVAAGLGFGGGLMLLSGIFGLIDPSVQFAGMAPEGRLAAGCILLVSLVGLLICMAVRSRRRVAGWRMPEASPA